MASFTIGVDVGGTNIKYGLVDAEGRIIARESFKTALFSNKHKLIKGLIDHILQSLHKYNILKKQVLGIGIGFPGLIDFPQGIVKTVTNLKGWNNVPLKKAMETQLGLPVFLDNDVNVIALGEWKYGAGKGYENIICITLGTGVGGGLILNNQLYRGKGFSAGEVGHIMINEKGPVCNCGGKGCLEAYVGNKVLLKNARKIFKNKEIAIEDIGVLAKKGTPAAIQFWQDTATHIGNALIGIVNLLNPELIIIGGGISNNYSFLGKTIMQIIKKNAMKVPARLVKVVRAKLGDDAGIIGAKVLVKEAIHV